MIRELYNFVRAYNELIDVYDFDFDITPIKNKIDELSSNFNLDEHTYGFSSEQCANLARILLDDKMKDELTGKIKSHNSGGHFYHIFVEMTDGLWIGFHSVTDSITLHDRNIDIDDDNWWYVATTITDGININKFNISANELLKRLTNG